MAKKKPAAKMPAKKPAPKPAKKPVKAAPKKEVKMAKKAPAKKAIPAKKTKAAPAKKAAPVKKPAAKPAPKPAAKSSFLKTASKLVAKVMPKGLTKEQIKKQKDKELKEKKIFEAKEKAQAAKDKIKAEAEKKKAKEQEKKDKENAKLQAKKDKENEKLQAKLDKENAKNAGKKGKKGKFSDEEDDDEDLELGPDDEPAFGEERVTARKTEEDDVDEFEEDYKKSKAAKKTGKKIYDEEVKIDLFEAKPSKKYQNAILADLEGKIADEIAELREHFNWKDIAESIGTMDFFIDPKNDECIEKGCDNIRTTQSYCRLHYLRNWKTIQKKRDILKEGKLQEYIEELISKYPIKYIEALMSDLSDDKEFYKVLNELNITSEFDFEEEDFENVADDDDDGDDIGIETISGGMRYEDE